MVPVKVGLENVEDVGLGGTVTGNYMVSEGAHAAPQIAQHMLIVTRIELHAGGIASESVRNGKVKLRVDPSPRLFLRVETLALSLIDAESRETGMEPRVPQNVTHSAIGQVPWAES